MRNRLLVTGGRTFPVSLNHVIHGALRPLLAGCEPGNAHEFVQVNGMCPPQRNVITDEVLACADWIASEFWVAMGGTLDPFPADWSAGKKGGPIRNQAMVNTRPDMCYGFPWHESRGTWGCMRMAYDAGIPTWWYNGSGVRRPFTLEEYDRRMPGLPKTASGHDDLFPV